MDDDRLVHGLAGTHMPADWPALQVDEVAGLLACFPQLGTLHQLAWHSPRPLSAAALADTTTGRLFIKRHHWRVRTPATLTEEHRFIDHLRAYAAPVPEVLRDAHGHSAIARGDWVFEVQAVAQGLDLYRDLQSWSPLLDTTHARQAGAALARLHEAAEGYRAPQRQTHILVARDDLIRATDPVAALGAQLPHRPGLAKYLRTRAWQDEFASQVLPLQQKVQSRLASQPRLWTHNDWHVSNLAWSSAGVDGVVSAVFDFGLASPTFALFDLATAIERNAIAWLQLDAHDDIAQPDTAKALIEGYGEVRRLDRTQLALLADLLPVVHIDFALSEIEYFDAITGSRHNADIAWNSFLIGHARWFKSAPAKALLKFIATIA